MAVMARILRDHQVKVATLRGETGEGLRERVRGTLEDSSVTLTLSINDKKRVKFLWERDL